MCEVSSGKLRGKQLKKTVKSWSVPQKTYVADDSCKYFLHCSVLRCTLKAIPHTQNLLQKVKLPLGLVVHPFKDLSSLPVISAGEMRIRQLMRH